MVRYRLSIVLMMVVLPVASILIDLAMHPGTPVMALVSKWFVFWLVGIRLLSAGIAQIIRPQFTARQIFGFKTEEAFPVIRELGIANSTAGIIAIASLVEATFMLPSAIFGAIFYGAATVGHITRKERSANEGTAMLTDGFAFVALAVVVCWSVFVTGGWR